MTPTEYRTLRQARGTQKQVAALLGIDRVTVAKREAGKLKVSRESELAMVALKPKPTTAPIKPWKPNVTCRWTDAE